MIKRTIKETVQETVKPWWGEPSCTCKTNS